MWGLTQKREAQPDCCVLCGEKTEYDRATPVAARDGYIAGAGQLCATCYRFLYLKGKGCDG